MHQQAGYLWPEIYLITVQLHNRGGILSIYYNLKNWRRTLDRLMAEKGVSLEDICSYIGSVYNGPDTSFYIKLPRKRNVYIGIGMALGQTVDVINSWITGYAGKKKLYAKDISGDLVWMYLINANIQDTEHKCNYYKRFEEYQAVAHAVFRERWDEIILRFEETSDVEVSLGQAEYGPEYEGIINYVAQHMDAFKTAYSKPRAYLDMYIERILMSCRTHPGLKQIRSINSMRGFLDDSMINFLTGDSSTINVIDRKTGKRTVSIKHIPKSRGKFIDLCIALGMTTEDINTFLRLMGYAPLDGTVSNEAPLMDALDVWERNHQQQRRFKSKYFTCDDNIVMSEEEEHRALEEMLQLRSDMRYMIADRGIVIDEM